MVRRTAHVTIAAPGLIGPCIARRAPLTGAVCYQWVDGLGGSACLQHRLAKENEAIPLDHAPLGILLNRGKSASRVHGLFSREVRLLFSREVRLRAPNAGLYLRTQSTKPAKPG